MWSGQKQVITATAGLRDVKQRCELVSSVTRSPSHRGRSSSAVGHRLPARADLPARTGRPALRRSWTRKAAVVVLPAVPVTPITGPEDRSSRRSARQRTRQPAARSRVTRGATSGVHTSRNASSCSPGSLSGPKRSRTVTPIRRSSSASAGAVPGPASVTSRPSLARRRASAIASGSNPSTSVMRDAAGAAPQVRPGRQMTILHSSGVTGQRLPDGQFLVGYLVCGKPRSTLLVEGSGQRDVTTFPRV